jgi:4'-phosphopantetheinyl transferase
LLQNNCSTFPNFNFNTSHQGDYVGIASELICLVGLDIVSISKPQGETTTEFISNFSSYLTDHEWDCIVHDATPSEVLTEFYRYTILFLLEFLDRRPIKSQSEFQLRYVASYMLGV